MVLGLQVSHHQDVVIKSIEEINHDHFNGIIELKKILKLSVIPNIIECFDISTLSGTENVGACIQFVDGKPNKKEYRHLMEIRGLQ